MAVPRRVKSNAPKGPKPEALALLKRLGLEIGDSVRWRKPGKTIYQYGNVTGANADGSIKLSHGGASRSIMPEQLQIRTRGPRKGIVWVPVVEE